jgi:hypothetical protein
LTSRLGFEIQNEGPSALLEKFWMKSREDDMVAAKELLPKLQAAGLKLPVMF